MPFLLIGMAVLLAFLLLTRVYTVANPQVLARQLRVGAGVAVMAGAGLLVFRGMIGYAMTLAALGSWLLWGSGGYTPGSAKKSAGQASRVRTQHLEVELDHDTGEISGRVLKGSFEGRVLESLAPAEMARLWQDCRFADPQSAQILEVYLDRVHPSWREDAARAESEHAPNADGPMTHEQALEILGLAPGATEQDIRRAHRDLMMKLHPDRGGSTFLAAKINQAKDALLSKRP